MNNDQPVNPLIPPRNKIAAEAHLAIAAQVLTWLPNSQHLRQAMADIRAVRVDADAVERAKRQQRVDAHNAKLAACKAAKKNKPARRGKMRAQRKRRKR